MVAIKAHQADAFLNALERVPAAVLFYGGDAGLVSERAAALARRLAEREGGELLRLDDADLEDDPDRIAVSSDIACSRAQYRAAVAGAASRQSLKARWGAELEGFRRGGRPLRPTKPCARCSNLRRRPVACSRTRRATSMPGGFGAGAAHCRFRRGQEAPDRQPGRDRPVPRGWRAARFRAARR